MKPIQQNLHLKILKALSRTFILWTTLTLLIAMLLQYFISGTGSWEFPFGLKAVFKKQPYDPHDL